MLFNSIEFILYFLPAVLLIYFAACLGFKNRHVFQLLLTAASIYFYAWRGIENLLILLGSIGFNFIIGRILTNKSSALDAYMKLTVTIGVIFNLALLGFFKYWNFVVDNINAVTNVQISYSTWDLPLAISFFTFLQIAYIVDCYKHRQNEHYEVMEYGLFVLFFPHLIAGPLVHHRKLISQLRNLKELSTPLWDNLSRGFSIFIFGLGKKILIADTLAYPANTVFNAANDGLVGPFFAIIGITAYTLQIYFDFSGYSDMAIGLSRMFGVTLPENFNSPYKAKNIVDFWRRWHMTLSAFLRDYLYFPLGGNRKGPFRRYINLMTTMLLGGIWHGAGWNFLIWGGLHGFYLCINHFWAHVAPNPSRPTRIILSPITILGVMFAWIFFRADNFTSALNVINSFWGTNDALLNQPVLSFKIVVTGLGAIFLVFGMPNSGEIFGRLPMGNAILQVIFSNKISRAFSVDPLWRPNWYWVSLTVIIGLASICFMDPETAEFIYYKF